MPRSLIGQGCLLAMREMASTMPPGAFVELGVYKGGSAEVLAEICREQGRSLWLFDSFVGILEWTEGLDFHKPGDFGDATLGEVRQLIPDAEIVVGDICETLPETATGPVAFAHFDVDQYATHRAAIVEMVPRMVRGGVMWFDDAGLLQGAKRAVEEAFGYRVETHPSGKRFVRF